MQQTEENCSISIVFKSPESKAKTHIKEFPHSGFIHPPLYLSLFRSVSISPWCIDTARNARWAIKKKSWTWHSYHSDRFDSRAVLRLQRKVPDLLSGTATRKTEKFYNGTLFIRHEVTENTTPLFHASVVFKDKGNLWLCSSKGCRILQMPKINWQSGASQFIKYHKERGWPKKISSLGEMETVL